MTCTSLLGVGGFGRVTLVHDEKKASCYALKAVAKTHVIETGQEEFIVNEKKVGGSARPVLVLDFLIFPNAGALNLLDHAIAGQ